MTCQQPVVPGEGHCAWCSHPYQQALLRLPRQRVAVAAAARWLGIPQATLRYYVRQARRRGCLPKGHTCPFCPAPSARGGHCAAPECVRKANTLYHRGYRARCRAGIPPRRQRGGGTPPRVVPAGVVLPDWPGKTGTGTVVPAVAEQRRRTPPLSPGRRYPIGSLWLGAAPGGAR